MLKNHSISYFEMNRVRTIHVISLTLYQTGSFSDPYFLVYLCYDVLLNMLCLSIDSIIRYHNQDFQLVIIALSGSWFRTDYNHYPTSHLIVATYPAILPCLLQLV